MYSFLKILIVEGEEEEKYLILTNEEKNVELHFNGGRVWSLWEPARWKSQIQFPKDFSDYTLGWCEEDRKSVV